MGKDQRRKFLLVSTLIALGLAQKVASQGNRLAEVAGPANQDKCVIGLCAQCSWINGCESCIRSRLVTDQNGVGTCDPQLNKIANCWKYFSETDESFVGCEICEGGKSPKYLGVNGGRDDYDCNAQSARTNCELDRAAPDRRILSAVKGKRQLEAADGSVYRFCERCIKGSFSNSGNKECRTVEAPLQNCAYYPYDGEGCSSCLESFTSDGNSGCVTLPGSVKGCNRAMIDGQRYFCTECNVNLNYFATSYNEETGNACTKSEMTPLNIKKHDGNNLTNLLGLTSVLLAMVLAIY